MLITGACKGIGKACSIALAEAGAHVIIISRTEKDLMDATLEFEQYLKNDYKLSVLQKNFQKRFFLKYDPTLVKDIYGEPAHSNEIKGVISSRFLQNNENILF